MQIHTTDSVAKLAGKHITKSIIDHEGDVLCLLSGGSALDVAEHIQPDKSECRTIFMMGDERVSREVDKNNYLQLITRYPNHQVSQNLVETVPKKSESINEFADRIEKKLQQIIHELNNPKIISLFGMGPDGHTAGIFPLPKIQFEAIYSEDRIYVPVYLEGLTIDSRASITPLFIEKYVNEGILYVHGDSKQAILNSLLNESKPVYERPAELLKQASNVHLFTNLSTYS